MKAKYNWKALQEDYNNQRLAGAIVKMKDFAHANGIEYKQVQARMQVYRWAETAQKLIAKRDAELQVAFIKQSERTLNKLQKEFSFSEVEIRKRHAGIARDLQVKSFDELKTRDVKLFSDRALLAMLQLGINEERRAMGLPEAFTFVPAMQHGDGSYKSVVEHIEESHKFQQLGKQLIDFIEGESKVIPERVPHTDQPLDTEPIDKDKK